MHTFYLDKHPKQYIPEDYNTHELNYTEGIMLPDGRLFYLTLGSHERNAFYICTGNEWHIETVNKTKVFKLKYDTALMDLCEYYGIISIHSYDTIVYGENVTKKQVMTFKHMHDNKYISHDVYNTIKRVYFGKLKRKNR